MTAAEKKRRLILQLAKFLVNNSGGKSISLEVESKRAPDDPRPAWAREWAALRDAACLPFGYPSEAEAIKCLTEVLK